MSLLPPLLLALSLCLLLLQISPTHSSPLTCTSQNFTTHYANCTDLPTLNASLHYTYNATNSSLSVAFIAAPSESGGWIGWGINPNATGMAGAQVLVAFKSKGVLLVKPFNLESYGSIKQEKLSFDTWDVRAESSGSSGDFVIFASVKVPAKAESVNQIWQVGPSVGEKKLGVHEFGDPNKQAKATLTLAAATTNGTKSTTPATAPTGAKSTTPATATAPTGANSTTDSKSSGFRLNIAGFFSFGLFAVLACFTGF